jgi:hypothetical protein
VDTLQTTRPATTQPATTQPATTQPAAPDEEPLRHLVLFVAAAVASAAVPFVVAAFTTGAVNAVTWFAICVAAAGAVMGAVACFLRFGNWAFERARRPIRRD